MKTSSTATSFLDGLFSAFIVNGAFVGVRKDFVCLRNFLELVASIGILVWVIFECQLSVSFLKFGFSCIRFYLEDVVKLNKKYSN